MHGSHFCGIYRAICVSADDPESRGRLLLRVPQILGGETLPYWAWPCFPSGWPGGLPEPGHGVWVMFEAGDPDRPVWMGVFSAT